MSSPFLSSQSSAFTLPKKKSDPLDGLKFIGDLGRSLLFTVHPKKVACKVAEAVRQKTGAEMCAFVAKLDRTGLVSCVFDSTNSESHDVLRKEEFKERFAVLPPQIPVWTEERKDFFLEGSHGFEYLSPLHINGQVKGALIVGFGKKSDCSRQTVSLIDAATQMAAMSFNLSAHYESAMDASINIAKEENRKFTETVLDELPVSLYVVDRNYKIVTWNKSREIGIQGISRDSVIGRSIFDVLKKDSPKRLRDEFERAFRTGKIEQIEQHATDEDGNTKHWLISKIPMRNRFSGEITHVITIGEDITARVEAMQTVARVEKLAAVGRLAAGVVHEINNPLATISACAEALEGRAVEGVFNDSPDVEDLKEYLGLIRSEAFRCKNITDGLLNFSRLRTGSRLPVNISEIVRYSARLISHQTRDKNIEIKIEEIAELPYVKADEGQIQQAVISLAANAADAMPEGGTLTFRTFARKNRVILEVRDTGIGIVPENLPKIYEPFYTTKETGKGTGLGLAVCYGIITEHNGRLSARSTPGTGTTFTVSLPACENDRA